MPGRCRLGACRGDARSAPAASARRAAAFAACRSWSNGAVAHMAKCTAWTKWGICSRRGRFRRRMPHIAVRIRWQFICNRGISAPACLGKGCLVSWNAKLNAGPWDVLPRSLHPVCVHCRIGLSPFRMRATCFPRLSAHARNQRPACFCVRPKIVADLAVGALAAPGSVRWRPTVCANHPDRL